MLFWRLEQQEMRWWDFTRIFNMLDEDEIMTQEYEDENKRNKEMAALVEYIRNRSNEFENELTKDHDKL
jgi:hypothetical protein